VQGAIEVGGLRTFCRVAGDGPPAILLHGWGGEGASLHPLAAHLAQRFRTITPDLPGFGGTAPPPGDWGVPEYASWTLQLLDKLGIGRALLLGHSNGGRIAIFLAATQPAIVDRLILVDSAGIRPDGTTTRQAVAAISKAGRAASTVPLLGGIAERLRGRWHRAVGAEDYANAGPLRGTFVRIVNQDLRELLPRIDAPTLLLWGADDESTPVADAHLMERLIPSARLTVFPGAGHFSYLERTAETCATIDAFLAACEDPPC
jgi:pimeloyl-ACP methyl ester carboxylesterase